MLPKECKKLLDYLVENSQGDYVDLGDLEDIYPLKSHFLDAYVRFLIEKEYLVYVKNDYGAILGVTPTAQAFSYKEMRFLEIRSFLIRSIFTPIAVSAATTLITLLIKELVSRM
ncbi:MAG: hypothetical protein Q4B15_07890 [Lachnospiraceae bacterium]|nr:hypothetical protein [Lachnospiraceae bacterium]